MELNCQSSRLDLADAAVRGEGIRNADWAGSDAHAIEESASWSSASLVSQPLEMQGAGACLHRPASRCISEDDGTRTRNHRIDSLPTVACETPDISGDSPSSVPRVAHQLHENL